MLGKYTITMKHKAMRIKRSSAEKLDIDEKTFREPVRSHLEVNQRSPRCGSGRSVETTCEPERDGNSEHAYCVLQRELEDT